MSKPIITLGIIILLATALTVGVLAWSATLPCTQPADQQQVANQYPVNNNTNQSINTNINIDVVDLDTSNWQTYRNEEYGFEFKYPRVWVIADASNIEGIEFKLKICTNDISVVECQKTWAEHEIRIEKTDIEDINNIKYRYTIDPDIIVEMGKTTLSEEIARETHIKGVDKKEAYFFQVIRDEHLYTIWLNNYTGDIKFDELKEFIRSNFKFTK